MTGILNAIFATFGGPWKTTVEYLVIAGGGGGGGAGGGGGGAGGYRTDTGFIATFGVAYTITNGAGGAAGAAATGVSGDGHELVLIRYSAP
jgi:hypothetical protein